MATLPSAVRFLRRVRRLLRGKQPVGTTPVFRTQARAFERAELLTRLFYPMLLFIALDGMRNWPAWIGAKVTQPLWPVFWLRHVPEAPAVYGIMFGSLLTILVACWMPQFRIVRLVTFLAFLEYAAFVSSFGKINHGLHLPLWAAFVLIFLPSGWQQMRGSLILFRQKFLTIFWGVQALLLLFYALTGYWKLYMAVIQIYYGQNHAFEPDALAEHIANRLLITGSSSIYGEFIIRHPFAGWPMYLGAIYLETFSIVAAFRPSLHKVWALGLIVFHLAVYLTMTINFTYSIMALSVFLLFSPFAADYIGWRTIVRDLPGIGLLGSLIRRCMPRSRSPG